MRVFQRHKAIDLKNNENNTHIHEQEKDLLAKTLQKQSNKSLEVWIKLHSNRKNIGNKIEKSRVKAMDLGPQIQTSSEFPSPIIELYPSIPTKLTLHHFEKFKSFQFGFSRILNKDTPNTEISRSMDLFEHVINKNMNYCLFTLGGPQSGISPLCEGFNEVEGIFYSSIAELTDRLQEMRQNGRQIKLILTFIAIADDQLYDLLQPHRLIELRQYSKTKPGLFCGASTFQPQSIYDLFKTLKKVYQNRNKMFRQSILIIQGEIQTDLIRQKQTKTFILVQWNKNSNKTDNIKINETTNNNSLMILNMCIFELAKLKENSIIEKDSSQNRNSIFRNCKITRIFKPYLLYCSRFILIGCISIDESQEKDSFQTLSLCKNMKKLEVKAKEPKHQESPFIQSSLRVDQSIKQIQEQIKSITKSEKVKTEEAVRHPQINTSMIRQKLKIMLQEKQKKRKESLRKIQQELGQEQPPHLPKIKRKSNAIRHQSNHMLDTDRKASKNEIITKQDENSIQKRKNKRLQDLIKQKNILLLQRQGNYKRQDYEKITKNLYEVEMAIQQKQIQEFLSEKQRIKRVLQKQLDNMYHSDHSEQIKVSQSVNISHHEIDHHKKLKTEPIQGGFSAQKPIRNEPSAFSNITMDKSIHIKKENPERYPQRYAQRYAAPKSLQTKDITVEKRRIVLKKKLQKGRVDLNNFFLQNSQKYQNYKPVEKK